LGRFLSTIAGFNGEQSRASARAPREAPEQLKRDPVCGTFVAPSASVTKVVRGETVYFCSEKCRDQYKDG